ncbi:hypothetical protein [Microbulbifer sp. SAOS-129_SWC]|uniref:hypothetical protein n=1 Tax=Microbulbifer sp. SAOS-129_SWC TaxID=3145235 RepID=UPI003217EB88
MHLCDPAQFTDDAAPPSKRPLWLALAAALLLHIAVLGIPLAKQEESRESRRTIDVTLVKPPAKPEPQSAPQPDTVTAPPQRLPQIPAERQSPEKPVSIAPAEPARAPTAPTAETTSESNTPEPSTLQPKTLIPATGAVEPPRDGAKRRSTVFDPRLRQQLSHERNKVKKFKPRQAEYMTNTGTFIQHGDTCGEYRELVPQDIDSHVVQWFKIKCTKRRRPQEDIDRLARKYGIP